MQVVSCIPARFNCDHGFDCSGTPEGTAYPLAKSSLVFWSIGLKSKILAALKFPVEAFDGKPIYSFRRHIGRATWIRRWTVCSTTRTVQESSGNRLRFSDGSRTVQTTLRSLSWKRFERSCSGSCAVQSAPRPDPFSTGSRRQVSELLCSGRFAQWCDHACAWPGRNAHVGNRFQRVGRIRWHSSQIADCPSEQLP